MKRLDPVYKRLLNERTLSSIPPDPSGWYNPLNPGGSQGPGGFYEPISDQWFQDIPKPMDPTLEVNPYGPEQYVPPGQPSPVPVAPEEVTDQWLLDLIKEIKGSGQSLYSLWQWLIYLANLGVITLPWWFWTYPIGGNPYAPGLGPDNWTGDWPVDPMWGPIIPPTVNQPIDLPDYINP